MVAQTAFYKRKHYRTACKGHGMPWKVRPGRTFPVLDRHRPSPHDLPPPTAWPQSEVRGNAIQPEKLLSGRKVDHTGVRILWLRVRRPRLATGLAAGILIY